MHHWDLSKLKGNASPLEQLLRCCCRSSLSALLLPQQSKTTEAADQYVHFSPELGFFRFNGFTHCKRARNSHKGSHRNNNNLNIISQHYIILHINAEKRLNKLNNDVSGGSSFLPVSVLSDILEWLSHHHKRSHLDSPMEKEWRKPYL